jgi:hypothetical protein
MTPNRRDSHSMTSERLEGRLDSTDSSEVGIGALQRPEASLNVRTM